MDTTQRQGKRGGYKRNWAKWVGLYVAIGGIIYLIIYLVAFHHGGSGGGGTGGGY